jgi:hypothetical protein
MEMQGNERKRILFAKYLTSELTVSGRLSFRLNRCRLETNRVNQGRPVQVACGENASDVIPRETAQSKRSPIGFSVKRAQPRDQNIPTRVEYPPMTRP